jgi:hypothetical protein
MIAFDDGRWPIVAVQRAGALTTADATAQIIAFDNLLRRREPFALIVADDDDASRGECDSGADAIATRWLEANHDLLQAWCRGIALIGPSPAAIEDEPLSVIGSPMARFSDTGRAEAWVLERLAEDRPVAEDATSFST